MSRHSLVDLSDGALLSELRSLVAQDRAVTASLLAHLAEVDARRLFAPAGYPSMFAYCVGELHFAEEAAYKRIHAARAARRFPEILDMVADGRLHLSAVVLLSPHLTPENADELLVAAAHGSKAGIERLVAERFPQPDLPSRIETLPVQLPAAEIANSGERQHAPGRVKFSETKPETSSSSIPVQPRVAALAPERYGLQFSVGQGTYEKLRRAQALLGQDAPSGELAQLFDRALDALIADLERRGRCATNRPRGARRASTFPRHVPAGVKRIVWARDGGRCTFVSEMGRRCEATTHLELDHVEPVARGGRATESNLRLRCRAHNRYAAEQVLGAGFMARKRDECVRTRSERKETKRGEKERRRAAVEARAAQERERVTAAIAEEGRRRLDPDTLREMAWLRALGPGGAAG